ncbi:MAG TPA: carbon-nitrogen hydrolase [Lentisphaeria bacterium]|nr:MAG: hypothetical protein A2X47_02510 [Lentisphaerae bacterium GWF2_38_69]HBM17034.1 carbon-nitrogen hydrolase [Lentisphaeria bacterium]
MKDFKMAVCQNKPLNDKKKSVARAIEMINEAAGEGANIVMLPEMFYYPYIIKELIQQEESKRETVSILQETAKANRIYLCTGSTVEKVEHKRFNKSYLISPQGDIILEYSKCHLYDVEFKELKIKESEYFSPGNDIKVADTEFGKVGIIICYDIRFPEMSRVLVNNGAEIILVPAAFNTISGNAHWHLFFRTRAVESQVYMAAASPARDDECKFKAYGHSLIIDPWGDILNEANEKEDIIYAQCSSERLLDVRNRLPLLVHKRSELYAKTK